MAERVIRIGAGSGFVNDSALAVGQLLDGGGRLDYLIFEYLAEGIMAWLAADEQRVPGSGFSPHLVGIHLGPHLATILDRGIKVVTNAGGLNPAGQAEAIRRAATAIGRTPRIAIVTGDDLRPQVDAIRDDDPGEMYSGAVLPAEIASINAYLGAFPIAQALAMGADIVVTGRNVDSALTLGPLIHEFGWGEDDTTGSRAVPPRGICSSAVRRRPEAPSPTGGRCPTGRRRAIRSPNAAPTAASSSPSRGAAAGWSVSVRSANN